MYYYYMRQFFCATNFIIPDGPGKCINTGILTAPLEIDGTSHIQSDFYASGDFWTESVNSLTAESLSATCKNIETCEGRTCRFVIENCEDVMNCDNPSQEVTFSRHCTLNKNCYERHGTNGRFVIQQYCPDGQKFNVVRMKCVPQILPGKYNCIFLKHLILIKKIKTYFEFRVTICKNL